MKNREKKVGLLISCFDTALTKFPRKFSTQFDTVHTLVRSSTYRTPPPVCLVTTVKTKVTHRTSLRRQCIEKPQKKKSHISSKIKKKK